MLIELKWNTIKWLDFLNNNLIKDSRWLIWEIIPWWISNSFLDKKLWHIYTSIATWKYIARWWHYHLKNIDRFSTISWTALWVFIDYRSWKKDVFSIILWNKKYDNSFWIESYTIDNDYMLTVKVPKKVYHLFVPLTDDYVTVFSLASEKHDDLDYVRISPFDIPEIKDLLDNFWIFDEKK